MKRILFSVIFCLSLFLVTYAQPVTYFGEIPENMLIRLKDVPSNNNFRASVERSDTIDILHYNIHLKVGDTNDPNISGYCVVEFKSKMDNINQILLDLKSLLVDSIRQDGQLRTFTFPSSKALVIDLQNPLMQGDSSAVEVYYHGHPVNDGSFGGFFFSNNSAFNIGISINQLPHNYGSAWHPCFDNFRERATYEYHITSDIANSVVCSGAFVDSSDNGDGTATWNWVVDQTIPSYLSSIASSDFAPVRWTFPGINGPIPVLLAAPAADTAKVKSSFVHLPEAFAMLEQHFGAYPFDKVGFSFVPFNGGGAMEHAGNIAYPLSVVDGNTTYETLAFHELAHQWFGNLVTPRTAEDIWLKEGFAVYAEKLFYESISGRAKYETEVNNNHEKVLSNAHVFDGSYLPLSPMPQYITYGKTTYTKAADVIHTLRTYMGDEPFFDCLKSFLQNNQFTDQTSYSLRDHLSDCSGMDMTNFFDDWVFAPGFPHFSIDSFQVKPEPNGWSGVTVHIRQRLSHAPHLYHQVPLEVTFMNDKMETITETIMASGSCTVFKTFLPFVPAFVCTDLKNKISDAITDNYRVVRTTGTNNFVLGKMNLNIQTIADSAFVRIEHNYIAPDSMKHRIKNLHLSQERYWRVDGLFPTGFDAKATIAYGELDANLVTTSEDSLRVMYRPSVSADWQIEKNVTQNFTGDHSDHKGNFTITHLKKGEYAFAIIQPGKVDSVISYPEEVCTVILSDKELLNVTDAIKVYPNPSTDHFIIEGNLNSNCSLEIFNLIGQKIYQQELSKGILKYTVNAENFNQGIMLVRISDSNHQVMFHKQVILRN